MTEHNLTENPNLEEINNTQVVEIESSEDDLELDLVSNISSLPAPEKRPELITDDALTGIYDEILVMLRKEHEQVTDYIDNFAEMVINQGDSTTSSKEALVNLVKIRTDIPDKMSKVADLMTRLKMKQPDTYKPYLNVDRPNSVIIGDISGERRELINAIKKAKSKGAK